MQFSSLKDYLKDFGNCSLVFAQIVGIFHVTEMNKL